jgi:sugar transferase (PEP-CTERM/EpsH1 system associated)
VSARWPAPNAPVDQDHHPRVLHVIPTLRVGGLENVVVRLVQEFEPRVHQAVVTPGPSGPLTRLFPAGVPVVAMGDRHRPDRWNALRLARVFRTLRPDIVHTRNWTCIDAVLAARLAGVPIVIHGEHGREAADPEGRNPLRKRLRRLLAPLVTQFVTVSEDLARWLIEDVGIPARKVTAIRNGVDIRRFERRDRAEARRALGIPEGAFAIGTVGRLDPVKDQVGLIRAFAHISDHARAVLLIAGDGPCRRELETTTASLGLAGRVRLLGGRDDIPRVLAGLDIFVLSSLGEGISNTILEAMAARLPVVATRVGGNPELVADGSTGLLVPPRSPEALASAFQQYLDEPGLAARHGHAGRARAEAEFSLDRMVAAYGGLYAQLLEARAAV